MSSLQNTTSAVEQRLPCHRLMRQLERKPLNPIAASLTDDPKTAEWLHHRLQNFVADVH